jgi:hypothetical protein
VAKIGGDLALLTLLALLLVPLPGLAQQPAPDEVTQTPSQTAAQQPLDLQEAVARDVLEPLQTGIQTQNLKQILAVFDSESVADFPQLRDRFKALLDSYAVLLFRYKILQASPEDGHASLTCEVDLDATPRDEGQVPIRRSTQLRLQLKQMPKGWQITAFTPSDFFTQ